MLELGPDAERFHAEIGSHAAAREIDLMVTVGDLAVAIATAFGGEVYSVADAAEAAALLPELLEPGDTVLVKASRGIGLEVVTEALARPAEPANAGTKPGPD
jgi:UDP-N-acetylmuramyl pentapeptide synthase